MARYKPQDHNSLLRPVVLSERIIPGSFAFALNCLVDHELDLAPLDARFKNDEVGAGAYDPRVMLKIVLLFTGMLVFSDYMRHKWAYEFRIDDMLRLFQVFAQESSVVIRATGPTDVEPLRSDNA
jgi:hypothetical protein